MIALALRAFSQMFEARFRGVLLKSLGLALLLLVLFGAGLGALARSLVARYDPLVATTLELLTGLALLVMAAYLLAPISSVVAGFFLDDIAETVEREDYPGEPVGRALPLAEAVGMSLRFMGVIALTNLIALVFLLVPGVNIAIFFLANAYLLGREYCELAASRYLGIVEARAFRRAHSAEVFLAGLLIAAVLSVPILNLLTPLFGTIFMVHYTRRLRGRAR